MTTTVIRSGSTTRIIVQARGIAGTEVNSSGHLIVTYTDGTSEDAGPVGCSSPTPTPTPALTLAYSDGTPLTYSDGVYLEYSA